MIHQVMCDRESGYGMCTECAHPIHSDCEYTETTTYATCKKNQESQPNPPLSGLTFLPIRLSPEIIELQKWHAYC